jgi:hypothetical protein
MEQPIGVVKVTTVPFYLKFKAALSTTIYYSYKFDHKMLLQFLFILHLRLAYSPQFISLINLHNHS